MHNTRPDQISHLPDAGDVMGALRRRSFATLATVSPAGVPHVAGVLYEIFGEQMYVSTLRSSRKARNVAASGRAAMCIPVRRLPVGPPSSVHFQASADVIDNDDPSVVAALERGALRSLTKHGELELPDGCFLRIQLPQRMLTYGLGMSLRTLIADPLSGAGSIDVEASV